MRIRVYTLTFILTMMAIGSAQAADAPPAATAENLIYSVDRIPERPFETARAVQVITSEDLARKNGLTLADVLMEEAGVYISNGHPSGGAAIVRGLPGRQVLILIDGVKINNAIWRTASSSKEELSLFDLSSIERIEIVRGVVSVLGTEALGGVINIITRRGPVGAETFGGTIGSRYASSDQSFAAPMELYGQSAKFRYTLGGVFSTAEDNKGGGSVGVQPYGEYKQRGAHASFDYFLSQEKTLTASYSGFEKLDAVRGGQILTGSSLKSELTPVRMQTGSLTYQDMTGRPWADSMRAAAYWNRQEDGVNEIRPNTPNVDSQTANTDRMLGLNLELSSFWGRHHVLYGLDYTTERIRSISLSENLTTGAVTSVRGRYLDHAQYKTMGAYVNDRFNIGKWLTASGGLRYGKFETSGDENVSPVGHINVDSSKSSTTTSVNLIFHPTEQLNVIASAMRGFRAPTIEDMTLFRETRNNLTVPNSDLSPERVMSYELGMKYENARVSGSAFYYHNKFTDLVGEAPGTYNGLPFFDQNGNGKQDGKELPVIQNRNISSAKLHGFELDGRVNVSASFLAWGNYTRQFGTTDVSGSAFDLLQPKFGTIGLRYRQSGRGLWAEALMRYGSSWFIDAERHAAGYHTFTVRMGAPITGSFSGTVAVENLTDEAIRYPNPGTSAIVFAPGRQVVVGTQYRFGR